MNHKGLIIETRMDSYKIYKITEELTFPYYCWQHSEKEIEWMDRKGEIHRTRIRRNGEYDKRTKVPDKDAVFLEFLGWIDNSGLRGQEYVP